MPQSNQNQPAVWSTSIEYFNSPIFEPRQPTRVDNLISQELEEYYRSNVGPQDGVGSLTYVNGSTWTGHNLYVPTNLTEETDMESRQERTERALRYIFKHRKEPDYNDPLWEGQVPIRIYRNKVGDIMLWNCYFDTKLAMIDVRHSLLVSRKDTVFLGILQDFATSRGYKLKRPPTFPRNGDLVRCTDVTEYLPELPIR